MTDQQPLWRHKKRGTVYEIVTEHAGLQCSAAQEFEDMFADDYWIVYRNVAVLWRKRHCDIFATMEQCRTCHIDISSTLATYHPDERRRKV